VAKYVYGRVRQATDALREICGAERKRVSEDCKEVQNEELHVSYGACAAAQCSCPLF